MPSVRYGSQSIQFTLQEKKGLKSHYISVERHSGVILKGEPISIDHANKLILKKAKWILDKLKVVGAESNETIVTGSRISYLGKYYYVEFKVNTTVDEVKVEFNYSKFKVTIKNNRVNQIEIRKAVEQFYRNKAVEKLTPRVTQLSNQHKLDFNGLQIRKMKKRWGSCTPNNDIILNPLAIMLPYSLIDYLIIHELCHVKVKDHSKAFWAELAKHLSGWKELDTKIVSLKFAH